MDEGTHIMFFGQIERPTEVCVCVCVCVCKVHSKEAIQSCQPRAGCLRRNAMNVLQKTCSLAQSTN